MLGEGDGVITWVRVALRDFRGYAVNARCRAAARIAKLTSGNTRGPCREAGIARVGQLEPRDFVVLIIAIIYLVQTAVLHNVAFAQVTGTSSVLTLRWPCKVDKFTVNIFKTFILTLFNAQFTL